MTDDRIHSAQKNIQELLKAKPEYVVNTSEFESVKGRLAVLQNHHKADPKDDNRPTLRRAGSGKIDDNGDKTSDDKDDRPTLKRRDGVD
jgi:beta-barrel assembly-enhancing protease